MFIGEQAERYRVDEGNVITIGLDTQTVFYQPTAFYTGQNIQVIRHDKLDKYNAIFLIVAIKKIVEKFSWGSYGATLTRLRKSRIYLPADKAGEIDWAFMTKFMQDLEADILHNTLKLYEKRANNTQNSRGGVNSQKWNEFYLNDIFTISAGKRLTKADMQAGNRPFIGATDSNNGITEWVSNTNESLDSHVLGVNYNGSVGEAFYHPYECIFSDDVKRLHLKDGINSHYVMLFLKTLILQQKVKYAYGYKFNEKRMQRQKLLLPAVVEYDSKTCTSRTRPDWEYMEEYMRTQESETIYQALQHFAERI